MKNLHLPLPEAPVSLPLSFKDRLRSLRPEILWSEICSILHDVGKLCYDFHSYRQIWMSRDDGWNQKDPHDHGWLGKDKGRELDKVEGLRAFFENAISHAATKPPADDYKPDCAFGCRLSPVPGVRPERNDII